MIDQHQMANVHFRRRPIMTRDEVILAICLRTLGTTGAAMLAALIGATAGNHAAGQELGHAVPPLVITWKMLVPSFTGGFAGGLGWSFRFYRKMFKAHLVTGYRPFVIGLLMAAMGIAVVFIIAATI
jgi:hypothetical protein